MAGFSYPVVSMPPALQALSHIFPLRHYYLSYTDIAMFGAPASQYLLHFCALGIFLVAGLIGGILLNRNLNRVTLDC
jgi:ABC-2 type transport system permease protein